MKILAFVFIFLIQACSNTQDKDCSITSTVTALEAEKLEQIVLNNHFLSGCVTESISDLKALSVTQNQCNTDFDKTLTYVQWLEIYNACMVK